MPIALSTGTGTDTLACVALAMVRDDEPDLTVRQFGILLTVYLEPPPHTVRGLATKLGVTKPVITRALDTMGQLELVSRGATRRTAATCSIQRTVEGRAVPRATRRHD